MLHVEEYYQTIRQKQMDVKLFLKHMLASQSYPPIGLFMHLMSV